MDLRQYKFFPSNLNVAVDDFIRHLLALEDRSEARQKVFRNGGRGLKLPGNGKDVADIPLFQIWTNDVALTVDSEQLYVSRAVAGIELFLHFYHDGADIQEKRQEFTDYVILSLQQPNPLTENLGEVAGLVPTLTDEGLPLWGFENPQQINVDHTAPYKRHTDMITVLPPNYVTLVEFNIWYLPNDTYTVV